MAQGNGADKTEPVEVRNIHVVNGVATSISTDGTTGMLKFTDPTGKEVALTFPMPGGLSVLQHMVFDLTTQARNRAAGVGMSAPRLPASYSIGHTDSLRNIVLLTFDGNTPHEAIYAVPDNDAWQFADGIRANILGRKTPGDRAKLLAGVSIPLGKLILPPGR